MADEPMGGSSLYGYLLLEAVYLIYSLSKCRYVDIIKDECGKALGM